MAGQPGTEELEDAEIQKIYDEIDGKEPKEDITEPNKEPADETQPAEKPKVDDAGKPEDGEVAPEADPDEPLPEGDEAQKAAKEAEDKAKEVKDKPITSDDIQAYAVKHSMTFAEAEADIKATQAVLKNYKSPEEIARALRSTQSAFDKLKSEKEKAPAVPMFQRMNDDQFIVAATKDMKENAEGHIANFRSKFPAKSELMTDDAIIEELAERALSGYRQFADNKERELKGKASETRETLLTGLSKDDQRFLPDVKAVLAKTSDQVILSDDGSLVKDLLYHAKGQRYDADVKAAYERGIKKGQEKPEIAGALNGGSGTPPKKPSGSVALNTAQKEQAEEMFSEYTPEDAHKMYADTWKDELKKDKNFLNK